VLRISEMERLRFGLDLHDDICQRLAGISMLCRELASGVSPKTLLPIYLK
jgi:signal transduction histidine kinase